MAVPRQSELREKGRNVYVFGLTSFMNDTASKMACLDPAGVHGFDWRGAGHVGYHRRDFGECCLRRQTGSGYLVDRIERRKPIVVAGYLVANAAKPLLALAQVWWQVLGIRFADRLAKGLRGEPRDIMLAEFRG